jgi:hypothetical protein
MFIFFILKRSALDGCVAMWDGGVTSSKCK